MEAFMKSHKLSLAILSLILITFLFVPGGCDLNQTTPQQMNTLADQVDNLSNQISTLQTQVTVSTDQMLKSGTIDPNSVAKVTKFNNEINKVRAQISQITEAIRNGSYNPNDDSFINLLKAALAANGATSSFNPYSGIITLVLTLIIAALTAFAKIKSNDARLAKTTLGAVTKAVEASPSTVQDAIKPQVANNLSAAGISMDGKMLIAQTKAA